MASGPVSYTHLYAKTNYKIGQVEMVKDDKHEVAVLRFIDSKGVEPLEVKAGFSFSNRHRP